MIVNEKLLIPLRDILSNYEHDFPEKRISSIYKGLDFFYGEILESHTRHLLDMAIKENIDASPDDVEEKIILSCANIVTRTIRQYYEEINLENEKDE